MKNPHKIEFFYVKSHSPLSNSTPNSPPMSKSLSPSPVKTLSFRAYKAPMKLFHKRHPFLILDLKHEGLFSFIMKYLIIRIYIGSLFGLLYSYMLMKAFEYFPYICFDDNFLHIFIEICYCKNGFAKLITYLRRGFLVVNMAVVCNIEVVKMVKNIRNFDYLCLLFSNHFLALIINLFSPEEWLYFTVCTITIGVIFLVFFLAGHHFFVVKSQRREFNIQFCALFLMFFINYLIYCLLNPVIFTSIQSIFFINQLRISVFILGFHLLMIYISSSRDALVDKFKPKEFVKHSIIITSNCVFSCTKMGFFLALNINEFAFYFNACCLVYSNITHTLNFVKKYLFFKLNCHKYKFLKKIGIWKICLKSTLDKKNINGSFIFERFLNYYILFYIYFSGKYFVDPLDAKLCKKLHFRLKR